MIEDLVGELRLRIRAPAGRERAAPGPVERFARAVLERCAERVERRHPGRLVFLQRLPVRWRLNEDELDDPDRIAKCAADLADAIEARASSLAGPDPGTGAGGVVVFDDEAHWWASSLLDRTREVRAWFPAPLGDAGDPLGLRGDPGRRDLAIAVLVRLAAQGHLVEVLTALAPEAVSGLAQALAIEAALILDGFEGTATGLVGEAAIPVRAETGPARPVPAPEPLVACAHALPAVLTRKARAVALHVEARRLLGPSATSRELDAAVRSALAESPPAAATSRSAARPSADAVRRPEAPGPEAVARVAPPDARPTGTRGSDPVGPGGQVATVVATEYGGLFYLLDRALELDLGEAIWKTCLPEGEVLAHAMAALLGPDAAGDPAPGLFGGTPADRPLPTISSEQQAEFAVALLAALAGALPRRGLAAVPETSVALVGHPLGQLLVASAAGSPFAIFAWPAPTPRAAEAGLRAFLAAWPRSAPTIRASPGLAELDSTARLRPWRAPARPPGPLVPPVASAPASALLAQTIGVLGHLFAARAGESAYPSASAFVARDLAVPARVALAPEEMTVAMPMERIDPRLRRAGLDRDPGWVPWLGRTVRIEFRADDPATDGGSDHGP